MRRSSPPAMRSGRSILRPPAEPGRSARPAAVLALVGLAVAVHGGAPDRQALAAPAKAARTKLAQAARPSAAGTEKVERQGKAVAFDRRWLDPYFTSGEARAAAEKFRREDYRAAVSGFARVARQAGARGSERLPALYMSAMAEMELGEWSAAGQILEDLHGKYTVLAPYTAYYAARSRLRRGDSEGALVWTKKVPADSVLAAEAVLIEIDALVALQRFAEVEALAGSFLERFPAGPRRAEAMYQRAQAMERLDRPLAEVAALYRRIWAEAPLETWSRRAEERLDALAAQAAAAPLTAGKLAPAPTAQDIKRFTPEDHLTRAMIFFDRNQNEAAEAAFSAALATAATGRPAGPSPQLRCTAEYHRAQSVFKQRQRTRAAPLFTQAQLACKQAGDRDLYTKALYQGARCLSSAGDKATALALYATVEKESPSHSYADDARLRAAEIHTDQEQFAEAAALLGDLPERYPGGDQMAEAMWRLALQAIRDRRFADAHRWLDENLRRIPRESIWYAEGRALYWKARVLEQEGGSAKRKEAIAFYERAIREYPLSVYAFLSFERLREAGVDSRRSLLAKLRATLPQASAGGGDWSFAPQLVFGTPAFRRAVELARMGFGSDARRELARLGFASPDREAARRTAAKAEKVAAEGGAEKTGKETGKGEAGKGEAEEAEEDREEEPGQARAGQTGARAARKSASAGDEPEAAADRREDVYWITSVLLNRGRSWAASHAIPRYTLTDFRRDYPAGLGAAKWRLAYPRAFPELVVAQSKANRVPESLQLAIMREESAFNPRIESFANALGLTQMLVKTARRFSEGRPVSRETLLDPARNVELGSRLLSFLLDRYGGLAPLAIASYNAGEGAVDRWLSERGDLPLDEFLETIPYDETRNYTKRVLSSYLTYAWLYDRSRPVPELRFSLKPHRHDRVGRPAGRPGARRPR